MSGAFGTGPSPIALRALTGAKRLNTAQDVQVGDVFAAVSANFPTNQLILNGTALICRGGFTLQNNSGIAATIVMVVRIVSTLFGPATLLTRNIVIPDTTVTPRYFCTDLMLNTLQDNALSTNFTVLSGFYSFTGLANAEPLWLPAAQLYPNDGWTLQMYFTSITGGTTMALSDTGALPKSASAQQVGVSYFINSPVNQLAG